MYQDLAPTPIPPLTLDRYVWLHLLAIFETCCKSSDLVRECFKVINPFLNMKKFGLHWQPPFPIRGATRPSKAPGVIQVAKSARADVCGRGRCPPWMVMESGQAELVATDYAFDDSVWIEP